MKLPPLHNTRAPAQWDIISQHIDFAGKTVLDLGCGGGDILFRCKLANAKAIGVDKNTFLLHKRAAEYGIFIDRITGGDIGELCTEPPPFDIDIVICFSVLPYLDNPTNILDWIRNHSEIALIESQYDGDGPGFPYTRIEDDVDFETFLRGCGFQSIKSIGKTLVEDRDKWRTIWMCK
jgi:SAM-dependent methyltransferase